MNDSAVSPVIGVLLMLTLTLIIVAILNTYAGGLMDTEPKAPAVTLQIMYSQKDGIEIRHVSGDPVPTSLVKLVLRPSETIFGRNASHYSSIIQKKYITNTSGDPSWENNITSMRPGELFIINITNMNSLLSDPGNEWLEKISKEENQGNTFFFEVYYKNSMICRNEVLIEG